MLADLKLAVRWLQQSPAFTITAIVTLALAIGANAAIFSVADAVLFRPLPYEQPDRLLTVRMEKRETGERFTLVPNTLVELIANSHSGVGEVARIEDGPPIVHNPGSGATYVQTSSVTANYFEVLGVRPYRGRVFLSAAEDGGARAAMLSFRAWRERFGGDESLVGRPLALGNQTFDIVGILPPGFVFPTPFESTPELITILQGSIGRNPNSLPSSNSFFPVVRLEPRVSLAQAQTELESLHSASGGSSDGTVPRLEPVRSALTQTGGPIVRYLLAGSLLLLLLGCANLANLLLARGQRRLRETGVRAALGATRAAIVRPVFIESALIGLLGATAATIVARAAFAAMVDSIPPEAYLGADVGVDARVLGFTLLLGLLASVAFGIGPAWLAARVDAAELIQRRHGGGHPRRLAGSSLVAVQVAIALVLVFGASITGRAFVALLRQPIGFEPERVITVSLGALAGGRGEALQQLTLRLIDELRQVPGVVAAGATSSLPRIRGAAWAPVFRPGTKVEIAEHMHALPGYFEAAGIPILSGRDITMDEARAQAPVAVVSARAARAIFGDQDPVGATFVDGSDRAVTVVGVVGNVLQRIGEQTAPPVYAPTVGAIRLGGLNLVVKTRVRDASIAEAVRQRVLANAPEAVVTVAWWSDRINALAAYRNPRFQSMVLGSFGVIALALTVLGVFGVVSVMVTTRTRDIGIRLAIGSTPGEVVRHSVARCLTPVVIGGAAGLMATRWLTHFAESQLYEVQARDPAVLALTSTVVLLAGITAAWIPARRAGRVNPVTVLRSE
jgi:predicted permease